MTTPTLEAVAKVLVINEKQEALILTVGEYKDRPDKSYKPDLPGGFVDPGETDLDAVVRELIEEAGIIADRSSFQLVFARTEYFDATNVSVTKYLYLLHLDSKPTVTLSWEHASYEWVTLKGLTANVEFRPFYKEAIEYAFRVGLVRE